LSFTAPYLQYRLQSAKVSTVITKDLSRLGRDYLKTGEYIEIIFPDYDVRYIAINDNVDTAKSENELLAFKNIFNDWYARDCSKKIKAVFKAKGQSGKPLSKPVYGYKISEMDKHQWGIDEEAANVVRRIFKLCIDGYGPSKIARILTEENVLNPTAYALSQGRDNGHRNANLNRWDHRTVASILERPEYCGHTVNFRTRRKSYKVKKTIRNPQENWMIFENTHEPIITQQQFDLVQDLRKNKRRPQRFEEINPFSAMESSATKHSSELFKAKKALTKAEKRIAELDRLFTRLYEDNVSGKVSDERYDIMSAGYENEQKKLKADAAELTAFIDEAEQKSTDVSSFIRVVQKYEHITELTPEIMHELIEKIVVYAPDNSNGHRTQQIEIHFRFDVAVATATVNRREYTKKRKAA
jgi:DNA invertase Pin-like site-specific DNA recombinase